ncbi:hypothetical protein AGMMS4952_14540 [Spirochaetia bacterium]|nr:hypothetical protein AGMMS4952_14540 [Spirochaetia bacterium]
MKTNKAFVIGIAVIALMAALLCAGCDFFGCPDPEDPPPITQEKFRDLVQNTATRTIELTEGSDVTLSGLKVNATRLTIKVASGATLRDCWKIGAGKYVVVSSGGNLRWGEGEENNLFVGATGSTANLRLTSGTFTVIGKDADKADYELSGHARVYQQNGEPFVIDEDQEFTIVTGKLTVTEQLGDNLEQIKPVLNIHADGGRLIIENFAALELAKGALVVLGGVTEDPSNPAEDRIARKPSGIISDHARPGYAAGIATGIVGILDSNHDQVKGYN